MSRHAALGAKSSLETASSEEIVHTVPTEALAKPDLVTSRVRGPGCGAYLLAELAELCGAASGASLYNHRRLAEFFRLKSACAKNRGARSVFASVGGNLWRFVPVE